SMLLTWARSIPWTSAPKTPRRRTLRSCATSDMCLSCLPVLTLEFAIIYRYIPDSNAKQRKLDERRLPEYLTQGADSGRHATGFMHTDERVFHTRDHRLRLGPDRGADAGAVSAAPVCSSARPRARLHGLADSGRHQREESELGRGQAIAALRDVGRLHRRLRPAEAPHHSGVADAGRLHHVLRVSQHLRPAARGAVVACVGHPRGTGRRRRRRAVRRWLTTLHHVPDAPPAGQRSSARHFLVV